MGRRRKNTARKYFSYDDVTEMLKCGAGSCSAQIKGNHAANLQRHLQRYHYEIYRKVVADFSLASTGAEASSAKRPRSSGQQKLTARLPAGTARVSISDQIIVSACVELCTVNGRPFALMEDSGFRKILDPLLNGLSTKTVINTENIRTRVALLADEMREEIRQQVKGRLISLKVDCVTCMDRSMLGVNLQFVSDGKIVLRTLAIKELKEGHTASYLQSILLEVLAAYNVELCQVYSITTDNGTNLVKSVKSLMEDQQQQSGSDDEGEVTGDQNAELQLTSDDPFDDTGPWPGVLRGVRCAAHTLQLAVDDAMKKSSVKATVAKAREVCKKLRCPNVMMMIKKLNLRKPILNCPTRWHSTHDMLERLLELQGFCVEVSATNRDLFLAGDEWSRIEDIVRALHPAKKTTLTLQSQQLTAGDFHGAWMKCVIDTGKVDSTFARSVVDALKARETLLPQNDAFRAAVFLDPRYDILLSEGDKQQARAHLSNTWANIVRFSRDANDCRESPTSSLGSDDELDALLKEKEKSQVSENYEKRRALKSIAAALSDFEREKRLKKDENVLAYWETQRLERPELHELAKVVLACPATQVSVERTFSSLKFILSPQRVNLSENTLDNILLIRANWGEKK